MPSCNNCESSELNREFRRNFCNLHDFYKPEIQDGVHIVDDALRELEREFPFFRVVPLKGLPHKGDCLHFSAEAQHEYGRRCFAEFRRFRGF